MRRSLGAWVKSRPAVRAVGRDAGRVPSPHILAPHSEIVWGFAAPGPFEASAAVAAE